jgi:hypothetical protein
MKLGKHAVKVLAVFAVLFVVGFALKFLNLHEGFVVHQPQMAALTREEGQKRLKFAAKKYNEKRVFLKNARNAANAAGLEPPTQTTTTATNNTNTVANNNNTNTATNNTNTAANNTNTINYNNNNNN